MNIYTHIYLFEKIKIIRWNKERNAFKIENKVASHKTCLITYVHTISALQDYSTVKLLTCV
jgi:hypothetical protein